jgi:hypothetical protein
VLLRIEAGEMEVTMFRPSERRTERRDARAAHASLLMIRRAGFATSGRLALALLGICAASIADSAPAPSSAPATSWVDAARFPDLQSAVNACPAGGTLFIAAGRHTVPSGGLIVSKSIAIRGEPGTRLLPFAVARDQPIIRIDPGTHELTDVQLVDLTLIADVRPDSLMPGNYGLVCNISQPGGKVSNLLLERVHVVNMGDDGIHLEGAGSGDRVFVFVTLRNAKATLCRGRGMYLRSGNLVSLYDCYFNGNDDCGVKADQSEVAFTGCAFEGNCRSPLVNWKWGGQVYLRTCILNRFDGCHWEQFASSLQPSNKRGLTIENSPGCTVSNSLFVNDREDPDPRARGIYCTFGGQSGLMACVFMPNRFDNVRTAIEVDTTAAGAAEGCIVYPQFVSAGQRQSPVIAPLRAKLGEWSAQGAGVSPGVAASVRGPASYTTATLPKLGSDDAGTTAFDKTRGALVVWDGQRWKEVSTR